LAELAVIIVNYRARDLLRDCLRSVHSSEGCTPAVCVVDNASGDGTMDMLATEFPAVHAVLLPENVGYGAANNVGIRQSLGDGSKHVAPDYILLLNPDTVLPANALASSVAFLEANTRAGAVGPKLVRQDGSLDKACRRGFPTPSVALYHFLGLDQRWPASPRFGRYNMTYLDIDQPSEVDSLVGAYLMLRTSALEAAGLFDEAFFMYGEDLDLCYRVKAAGWQVWYDPSVTILHYKGASSKQNSAKANYEFYRSMLIFHRKHYAQRTFFLLNWLIVTAIFFKGGWAMLENSRRPRVGSA
jgi:N-acetylglucosaminyl-diphospho-decaprenol L-rhamnosyltransferase